MQAEERDKKTNNGSIETSSLKTGKKNNFKNEQRLRSLQDTIKCTNMCIKRVPERGERDEGVERIFEEIMAENIPNFILKN